MNKCVAAMAAILAVSSGAMAQIPNAGFENWTTTGNYMEPTGWHSVNDFIDSAAAYFPVTRSTDHYPASTGSYSMRLETNAALAAPVSWALAMTTGLQSGDRPLFPVTGHPDTLCGYYKFLPQGDTLDMHIHLYKNGNETAMGRWISGSAVQGWVRFTIPISDYTDADSARITISAVCEGPNKTMNVYGNSLLFVDNLNLVESDISVESSTLSSKASDITVAGGVLSYTLAAAADVSIRIFDVRGRVVSSCLGQSRSPGSYAMPLSLSSGIYALRFDAGDVHVRKSFAIMH